MGFVRPQARIPALVSPANHRVTPVRARRFCRRRRAPILRVSATPEDAMRPRKGILTTTVVAITVLLAIPDERLGADSFTWSVNTWADGIVRYRFAGSLDKDRKGKLAVLMDATTKTRVRGQMAVWENALKVPDPADP